MFQDHYSWNEASFPSTVTEAAKIGRCDSVPEAAIMNILLGTALAFGISGDMLPPAPDDVMRLPDSLAEQLHEQVYRRGTNADRRLDLLARYMFSSNGLGFSYIVEPTRDVAGTYAAGRGNCLSFTLLFLAMADAVGIRAEPREVQVPINWRRDGESLYESGHVNVRVDTGQRRAVVDFEPDPIMSHRLSMTRRGQTISRERALAHFYNNRAAELLAQGQTELARIWSEQALALAPEFAAALNNRGVIEGRLGQVQTARHFYDRALMVEPDNGNTLFNLYELHRRNNQPEQAEEVLGRLENLRSRDPYLHWSLGRNFEEIGEFERAERLYQQAIRLRDHEPMFHAAAARVAMTMGDWDRAERALVQAMSLSQASPDMNFSWDDSLLALKSRLPKGEPVAY
jgi:tetratricopeptide (TPR) repeat protein